MSGFNPLGDLKSWHIYALIFLAGAALVTILIFAFNLFMWAIEHIKIV